jgi:hypothetical protein
VSSTETCKLQIVACKELLGPAWPEWMNDVEPGPSTRVHRYPVAVKNIAFADVDHTSKGIVLYVKDASSSIFSATGDAELLHNHAEYLDSKHWQYDHLSHPTFYL